MDFTWYLNRLRKMNLAEVYKRLSEHLDIYYSRIKYHNPGKWPYSRFAPDGVDLMLHPLPGIPVDNNWRHYWIYNIEFDLTKPLNWYFSENNGSFWPFCHYSKINYRPGNPYGDIRINWELNRLQFLPAMALTDEDFAKSILADWLIKNPYLCGPGYLSAMEVALRWLSIYWAICLFKQPLKKSFQKSLTGLAIASGKYIEGRLSTYSSAGNHLIIEAIGLFWIGKALENERIGQVWIEKARNILWKQIIRQLNPDGTNQEQTFWYLGFVLDAIFHYFLLEERINIPSEAWARCEKVLDFINDMTLPDGSFPDYGDRDDGYVFRLHSNFDESPFPGLLNLGSFFFKRPEWHRDSQQANDRLAFWTCKREQDSEENNSRRNQQVFSEQPLMRTYNDGGMTLMKWGKGRLLFRHAPLGLGNTCGHGHADALSILFHWGNVPVLVDLGSGQYNGDQAIRNFFRSTIAHNTVEIGWKNQARIIGPFMWEKPYETKLIKSQKSPFLSAEASHDGYMDDFSVTHTRKIEWPTLHQLEIRDSLTGSKELPVRGAFHLGDCRAVAQKKNSIEVDFGDFIFSLSLPPEFLVEVYYGSKHPFMGWQSKIYGKWKPIHSILFSSKLERDYLHKITLSVTEK